NDRNRSCRSGSNRGRRTGPGHSMRDSSSPELCVVDPHRWCVYLLTLTDCSAFKIGFSCNLLQRLYSFSHRYFEQFDLRESLALRLEGEAQARCIEATLKQEFSSAQLSA